MLTALTAFTRSTPPLLRLLIAGVLLALLFWIDGESPRDRDYRLQRETTLAYQDSAREWARTHGDSAAASWINATLEPDDRTPRHLVKKWRGPVLIEVHSEQDAEYQQQVDAIIAWAAPTLREVVLRRAATGEIPRLVIYFGDGIDYFRKYGRGGGSSFLHMASSPDGAIISAEIHINPARFSAETFRRELGRLMVRALGLDPIPADDTASIFAPQTTVVYPTPWDHGMLAMLYDQDLPTGILTRDLRIALNP